MKCESSTFSAASADSVSDLNGPECAPSPSVKSIPSAGACSQSIGLACPVTTTCEALLRRDLEQMAFPSMSSVVASHAKTYPEQTVFGVAAQGFKARVLAFGQSMPDLFAKFDPVSSSWKMSQTSAIVSATFSETWPRAGMTRNGTAYKRVWLVSYPGDERLDGQYRQGKPSRYTGGIFDAIARSSPYSASGQDWLSEPAIRRVVDGTPNRLDRIRRTKAVGNAVVPQIPEIIGRAIMKALPSDVVRDR
jgi:hypothetical protein